MGRTYRNKADELCKVMSGKISLVFLFTLNEASFFVHLLFFLHFSLNEALLWVTKV